jgi:hypothetical protein
MMKAQYANSVGTMLAVETAPEIQGGATHGGATHAPSTHIVL